MNVLCICDITQENLFDEWREQVTTEGHTILWKTVPRCLVNATNRLAEAEKVRTIIQSVQCDAVQLLGAVPVVKGMFGADGHGSRPIAFDTYYVTSTPLSLNSSGAYIQANGRINKPIGRLNFSDLPATGGSNTYIPEGCHKGERMYPHVVDRVMMAGYLERNLAYRRSQTKFEPIGWNHGGNLAVGQGEVDLAARVAKMPQLTWTRRDDWKYETAPQNLTWYFNTAANEEMWKLACLGNPPKHQECMIFQNWRSFSVSPYDAGSMIRRIVGLGAMNAMWGKSHWHLPPGASTMADVMRASVCGIANVEFHNAWHGDMTFPNKPVAPQDPPPGNKPLAATEELIEQPGNP